MTGTFINIGRAMNSSNCSEKRICNFAEQSGNCSYPLTQRYRILHLLPIFPHLSTDRRDKGPRFHSLLSGTKIWCSNYSLFGFLLLLSFLSLQSLCIFVLRGCLYQCISSYKCSKVSLNFSLSLFLRV